MIFQPVRDAQQLWERTYSEQLPLILQPGPRPWLIPAVNPLDREDRPAADLPTTKGDRRSTFPGSAAGASRETS